MCRLTQFAAPRQQRKHWLKQILYMHKSTRCNIYMTNKKPSPSLSDFICPNTHSIIKEYRRWGKLFSILSGGMVSVNYVPIGWRVFGISHKICFVLCKKFIGFVSPFGLCMALRILGISCLCADVWWCSQSHWCCYFLPQHCPIGTTHLINIQVVK